MWQIWQFSWPNLAKFGISNGKFPRSQIVCARKCVCVRERERKKIGTERKRETERERERERGGGGGGGGGGDR